MRRSDNAESCVSDHLMLGCWTLDVKRVGFIVAGGCQSDRSTTDYRFHRLHIEHHSVCVPCVLLRLFILPSLPLRLGGFARDHLFRLAERQTCRILVVGLGWEVMEGVAGLMGEAINTFHSQLPRPDASETRPCLSPNSSPVAVLMAKRSNSNSSPASSRSTTNGRRKKSAGSSAGCAPTIKPPAHRATVTDRRYKPKSEAWPPLSIQNSKFNIQHSRIGLPNCPRK